MIQLATAQQLRGLDECAETTYMLPETHLMENASEHLARAAAERLPEGGRCVVLASCGNNGGDGIACAVLLRAEGKDAAVLLVGDEAKMTGQTREMARRLRAAGGELVPYDPDSQAQKEHLAGCDVIVDALFGVGLNRPIEGRAARAVEAINQSRAFVIAADIPSGVEADTGRVLGTAVRADLTVTFTCGKIGQFVTPGCTYCGEVVICSIGIPRELTDALSRDTFVLEKGDFALPRRECDSYKGTYGRVLIAGGSVGFTGAPLMAGQAASRTGSGLVMLAVPESVYALTAMRCTEIMPFPLPADEDGVISYEARENLLETMKDCRAALIGPGMSRTMMTGYLVENLLKHCEIPLVLDADGINSLEGNIHALDEAKCPVVLTPHEGEFARLGGDTKTPGRVESARRFAQAHQCVVVLKGYRTVTALPDGTVYINPTGGPALAKGGSGDVLAGMTVSLLGQGFPVKDAVLTAVYLHGLAGDLCAAELTDYSVTASDVIAAIPRAIKTILK